MRIYECVCLFGSCCCCCCRGNDAFQQRFMVHIPGLGWLVGYLVWWEFIWFGKKIHLKRQQSNERVAVTFNYITHTQKMWEFIGEVWIFHTDTHTYVFLKMCVCGRVMFFLFVEIMKLLLPLLIVWELLAQVHCSVWLPHHDSWRDCSCLWLLIMNKFEAYL